MVEWALCALNIQFTNGSNKQIAIEYSIVKLIRQDHCPFPPMDQIDELELSSQLSDGPIVHWIFNSRMDQITLLDEVSPSLNYLIIAPLVHGPNKDK